MNYVIKVGRSRGGLLENLIFSSTNLSLLIAATMWNTVDTVKSPVRTAP